MRSAAESLRRDSNGNGVHRLRHLHKLLLPSAYALGTCTYSRFISPIIPLAPAPPPPVIPSKPASRRPRLPRCYCGFSSPRLLDLHHQCSRISIAANEVVLQQSPSRVSADRRAVYYSMTTSFSSNEDAVQQLDNNKH